MLRSVILPVVLATSVLAHGEHNEDSGQSYMERHMASEHHIDSFDPLSFFNLHDLDRDGILDRKELEAIYGVHHETSRKKSNDDQHHAQKTEEILNQVLKVLDFNGDGVVTKSEFLEGVRRGGLPNFEGIEGLGHHYDVEGEYFLHHEEIYHNTPETQTDESYIHPEDIEHFQNHEAIEQAEEVLALRAQGLDPDGQPLDSTQHTFNDPEEAARYQRSESARAAAKKYTDLSREANNRGEFSGFKRPKDKADRLRVGVPYKYKVKKSSLFGDF